MYWLIFVFLMAGTVYEIFYGKDNNNKITKYWFYAGIFLLTLIAAMRYGQGTDYFGYKKCYGIDNLEHYALASLEPGYRFLTYGLNSIGIPYTVFVIALSFFEMFGVYRFLNKYSPYKVLSLLLFYPTLYLTYIFSCYRQAIALCIFLGFGIPLLQEKKYVKYCVIIAVAVAFHKTALLLWGIPLLAQIPYKYLRVMILPAAACGILLCFLDVSAVLRFFLQEKYSHYLNVWGAHNYSFMGMAERTVMVVFILWSSHKYKRGNEKDFVTLLCKIYVIGYMISVGTMRYSLISSRTGMYFKAVEIILIPLLMAEMGNQLKKCVMTVLILYTGVFLYKNINAYILQAGYQKTTAWTYPYISIFSKDSVEQGMITRWEAIYSDDIKKRAIINN